MMPWFWMWMACRGQDATPEPAVQTPPPTNTARATQPPEPSPAAAAPPVPAGETPSWPASRADDWENLPPETLADMWRESYIDPFSGQLFLHLDPGHYIMEDHNRESDHYHKRSLHLSAYNRESRIPLVIYSPGDTAPGDRSERASLRSIGSTLYDLLGVPKPAEVTAAALDVPEGISPKVIVVLVYDGLPYAYWDQYLSRMPNHRELLTKSREYPNTWTGQMTSSTTVSHASMATGQTPRFTGIPMNHVRIVGGDFDDMLNGSPELLRVPTVADLYDAMHDNKPVVASFCSQSRAAVTMAGHGIAHPGGDRDIVVWQTDHIHRLTTNTDHYVLPDYLSSLTPKKWRNNQDELTFRGVRVESDKSMFRSPYNALYGESVVEQILDHEPFGEDELPDLLFFNQKVLDNLAHAYGADNDEMRDGMDALDGFIGRFTDSLHRRFGDDFLLFITSDHGFGPTLLRPGVDERRHDRVTLQRELNAELGVEAVTDLYYLNVFLDEAALVAGGRTPADVCTILEQRDWVQECFTREQIPR